MNPYSDVSLENAPEQSDKTPANAPASTAPTNPYEDTAKQFEQKRDLLLNRAIKRSLGNPPDEVASILGISRNTGLSLEVVRNNREDVETRVKQREIGAQVASLSQTGQEWLTEKYNLDISQDDLANIKAMDDAITNKSWYEKDFLDKLMDSSVKTGTINVRQMASSIEATPGMNRIPEFDRIDELLAEGDREAALSYVRENDRALAGTALKADLLRYIGAEPEERADLRAMSMEQISRSASQIAQQESERQAIPNDPGLTRAMEDGSASAVLGAIADDPGIIPRVTVESLITSAPSLAAGVFGTMSGALPAAAGSAMASYGTERGLGLISALRDAGVDTSDPDQLIAAMTDPSILEDAQRRAELKALPISMLDMLGAGLASHLLAPTSVAGKTLTTRQREAINLFTQMPVQGVQEGAGEASGQYLADGEVNTAEVALETIAGAFGSTSDVLAFSGNRVFESVVNNANSYRRAKKDRAYLTAVKDAANQTQLRKRDPQALKELLNRLSQTGPVDEIYISGKDFQELFQSKNLDPEEYAQKMESVGQQYHESLLTGGDIAVSVADFAAVIAPTEAAEDFITRARTKTDGMSPAEADQWMNEQARPTLEAIINYDGDQAGASAQKVFDDVVGQLLATGMDQQTAERNASLYRAFFDVMGQTEDVDPFDLYQQYNLAITREMPEILKRRDNNVDALDPLLDRLRSGDVPSQQAIFGNSLTDFLREQGGVQDYAGELSAMDADKSREAFQRKLVNEQGLDLATAAERAAEAGYIESRDTNQLLAALDTELRGEPVYARGNENAKLQETAADLMALQEELDRLGIDLAEVDNATAKEALNSVVYGDAQQGVEVELDQTAPQSEAFKRWFGDSKVVDESGEPLVMYHGTDSDFTAFEKDRVKSRFPYSFGFHFTSAQWDADAYTRTGVGESGVETISGSNVMPVYLKAENPLIIETDKPAASMEADLDRGKIIEQLVMAKRRGRSYDSVIIKKTHDKAENSEWDHWNVIVFEPEQIKSAIGNRGTFDPNDTSILNQSAPAQSDRLSAIHNLSAENLQFADQMGGLAVPSIGIVGQDSGGVEGFGEITLIGNRNLADPDQVPAYSSDAYTARFPQPEYRKAKKRDADKLASVVDGFDERFGDRGTVGPQTFDAAYNNPDPQKIIDLWLRSNSVKAAYLDSIGESVDPVMRDGMQGLKFPEVARPEFAEYQNPARLRQALQNYGSDEYRAMSDALIAARRARYQEQFGERFPDRVDRLVNAAMNEDGLIPFSDEIEITAAVSAIGEQEVDRQTTREKLDAAIDEADFREWVNDQVMTVFPEPFIQLGRKKVPYTLDNIVSAMTKDADARGREETLTFGTGQARAASATRFVDLEQMREAAKTAIKDPEAYKATKEQTEQLLSAYREDISQFTSIQNYRGTPDVFAGMDGAMAAVARYLGSKTRDRKAFERALRAEEFNVDAIRAAASEGNQRGVDDRLVQTLQSDLMKWQDRLDKVTAMDANDSRLPTIREKITELQQQLNEAQDTAPEQPRDLIALGMEAAEALEKAPVPYFESKPARAVELSEFSGAVIPKNASDQVRQILERNGLPFAEYQEGNRDQAIREFRSQLAEQGEGVLFQDIGGKRGVIRIDRTNRNFNIELLAKADLSTFLHESGHFFLEVLGDLSQREGASERVKGQYQTILDWFEVESRDQIGVEQHEQFARGFEAYLMEGKAPTPELQSVFARFRAWLMAVYKRLTALNVDLTDEVRNVMDRILATDEEIERARGEAGMTDSLSDVAAMGWTEKERADYRDLIEEAREAAKSELIARQMKDLRKTEKDWYKQERAKVRDDVMQEISQNRVYRALAHLQNGKLPDGSELPDGVQPVKLSKEILVAEYGTEFLKRLPGPRNKLYGGPYLYSREGGVSPDFLADLYGFSSGDEMIQAFANARPMKPLAEAEADARMRERYPDINLSGEAAEAAIAAVHNDKAAERLLMEMKKLHSKSRFARNPMTPAHVLRQAAQRLIQGQRVKDIRPDLYRRAEARAANDAFTEATNNDFDSAFESKQRQLLNHYLYREAAEARETAENTLEYVKRFNKKTTRQRIGKAGGDYLEQIDAIIDQYEFRRVSLRQINRRRSLQSWVDELKADGIEPDIPQSVLQQARTINYKEISVEELQGIRDALTSIEHLARTKNKLLSSQFKREFGETVDSIVSSIEAHHEIKREALFTPKTQLKGLKNWADQYVAAHAKPEFIFEYLDGNESMGPVWQSLFKPLADAENAENRMTGEAMERLTEIMGAFKEEQRAQWFARKTYIPEIGTSMTKSNMIALALNWGNEGNKKAVLEGYGWSQAQAQAVLNKLTEQEWQMVQNIWDLIDSYWSDIAQLQKDLTGLAPEKVERTPVETPFGVLPGGYYPLKYDPETSFLQFKRDESVNTQDLFENNFLKPTTKKGHTIERVGSAGMQVRLDLAVLGEHIYQVIHDLSHRRAIIDVDRLIGNVRVRHAIEGTAGKEAYRQLRPWLQAIANDTRQPSLPWERVISHMRAGGTIVNMGWKFTTAIVQPLGYLQSVDQIGAKWAWKGLRDFYGSPDKMAKQVDFVFERSEAMKNRQRNFDRDVRDYARRLEREGRMDGVRESFFWMTGMLDMSVSVPTWLGAYRKAMEGHVPNAAKGDEAAAIDYADQAVRESQSSGAVKDLARIQRGNEAFRAFTMFYSYFSALFNLLRRRRQDLQLGNINLPQFAASMAVLWIAPAVLGELVAMRGPDDDEEWAKWAAQQSILYPFQTMIGVRDVANAALTPFGFGASPAYDGLEQTARALQIPYKVATGEEVKRSDVKSIVLATSYWGHLPGRQAWITGEYLFDVMDDKENPDNPLEFMEGVMFSRPASER